MTALADLERELAPWLTSVPARRSPREIIARAIYHARPYRIAATSGVMDGFLKPKFEPDFDGAPVFYQFECYELADAIILDLALAEQGEVRS